ncbi:hypothetical protein B1M_41973, partial [Burkholderia sp. TJI49]
LKELAPLLLEAASDMSAATLGSPWFKRAGAAGVPAQAAPVPVAAAKPAARGRTAKR